MKRISARSKKDGSPVTVADRDAERSMRAEIQPRFPSHGIVGEEFEETIGVAEYLWLWFLRLASITTASIF